MSDLRSRNSDLLKSLPKNSVILLESAPELIRNGDAYYPYRQSSNTLYLTDCDEANVLWAMKLNEDKIEIHMVCQPENPKLSAWVGKWTTPENAKNKYDIDFAVSIECWHDWLLKILPGVKHVWLDFSNAKKNKEHLRTVSDFRFSLNDVSSYVAKQRMVKDQLGVGYLRKAVDISCQAHLFVMQNYKKDWHESGVEANFFKVGRSLSAKYLAYTTIAAAGDRACVLHYIKNNQKINEKDLVLLDAGFEYNGYAADITRTFPANGRFSQQQKDLYNLVLESQQAAIEMIKPNADWQDLEDKVRDVLLAGCLELGVFSDEALKLKSKDLLRLVFPHGLGHHLGLDVHDSCLDGRFNYLLKEGNVITIEPGLYLNKNCQYINEKWQGMGVRIEDDILVTAKGFEVLSAKLVKTVDEIESVMSR